jgi:hypothetical protein
MFGGKRDGPRDQFRSNGRRQPRTVKTPRDYFVAPETLRRIQPST